LNLGHPENDVSIAELARLISGVFAARMPRAQPARFRHVSAEELYGPGYDDSEERIPDVSKAKRLLDWEAKQTLAQMLPAIVDDYVTRYAPRVMRSIDEPAVAQPARALPL
jgi:UDP-apiose/xylose synthase